MRPLVDLIILRAKDQVDFFARNHRGLHVPVGSMTYELQEKAERSTWARRQHDLQRRGEK